MKHRPVSLSPRVALFIGAALLSTPALAQDVTPPPVVSTVPAPAPAPAPAQPAVTFAPSAPMVQSVPETPPPAATPARATTRAPATATRTATTRTTTTSTAPAPQAAAPAPAANPLSSPQSAPVPPVPVSETVNAAIEAQQGVTATTVTEPIVTETPAPAETPAPIWPWLLVGALIVAGAVIALLLRRRPETDQVYEEPYEPIAAAAPVAREPVAPRVQPRHEPEVLRPAVAAAAAPLVLDDPAEPEIDYAEPSADVELHNADQEDLAGLTTKAPVSERPWLEFGMRPVRAGTSADEALVEIELTVGNAGDQPAKDVRISTFMLADGDTSHMEELLIERGEPTVPPVTIKPGEGTRVDATLAVRKDRLDGEFDPVVVADARYTLADGSEGRTSATFRVGLWGESERLEPIAFDRPEMHRDIAAELVGTPEHA